jgi:hypothetical protein
MKQMLLSRDKPFDLPGKRWQVVKLNLEDIPKLLQIGFNP